VRNSLREFFSNSLFERIETIKVFIPNI